MPETCHLLFFGLNERKFVEIVMWSLGFESLHRLYFLCNGREKKFQVFTVVPSDHTSEWMFLAIVSWVTL